MFWSRASTRRVAFAVLVLALAVWAFVLVRESRKRPVHQRIDAGIAFVRGGRTYEAERAWLDAAAVAPDNPLVWRLLGELYLETEQWPKGVAAFQKLERLAPDTPYLYSRLATCALRTGEEMQAMGYAQQALQRNPGDDASLAILSFVSEMQDDPDRQIDYLQRLLKNHPDDAEFLQSLIKAYQRKGQYADILPLAKRLLDLRPNDPVSPAMRAMALFESDASPAALKEAEADLNRALARNADYPFARYYLGRVYLRQGRTADAVAQLEAARRLNPREMKAVFELAGAYGRAGRRADAASARRDFEALRDEATRMSVLQKRCALDRNDFDSHLALGELTLSRADYRQAGYYLGRAVALRPDSAAARDAYRRMQDALRAGGVGGTPPPAEGARP